MKYAVFALICGAILLMGWVMSGGNPKAPASQRAPMTKQLNASVTSPSPNRDIHQLLLPEKGTPLVQVRSELEVRIEKGDLEAAKRVVEDTLHCEWANQTAIGIGKRLDIKLAPDSSPEAMALDGQNTEILQEKLLSVSRIQKMCEGISPAEISAQIYPALLNAARLGDKNAASCYVAAAFNSNGVQEDPDATASYRENAPSLIERGILAGDWTMAYLAEVASSSSKSDDGWFGSLMKPDRLVSYKYKKLRRLGTTGESVEELDIELAKDVSDLIRQQRLSAADIAAADQWANAAYDQYFSQSPKLNGPPSPCSDPYLGMRY